MKTVRFYTLILNALILLFSKVSFAENSCQQIFNNPETKTYIQASHANESKKTLSQQWQNLIYRLNQFRDPMDVSFSHEKVEDFKNKINIEGLDNLENLKVLLATESNRVSLELIIALSEVYSKSLNLDFKTTDLVKENSRRGQKLRLLLSKYQKIENSKKVLQQEYNVKEVHSFIADLGEVYWLFHEKQLGLIESFKYKEFRDHVIQKRIETEIYSKGVFEGLISLGLLQTPPQTALFKRTIVSIFNPVSDFNQYLYYVSANIFAYKHMGQFMYIKFGILPSLDITQQASLPPMTFAEIMNGQHVQKIEMWKDSLQSKAQIDYGINILKSAVLASTAIAFIDYMLIYGPLYLQSGVINY